MYSRVLRDEGRAVVADRVRNRAEDLVRFEIAQINPRDPVIGVVVYEQPAAIVFRIGLRKRRVMHVAPGEIAQHLLRFLVESVTGGRIRREDWNGGDVAHRWNARDKHLAGMSAGIEKIVFILLAGRDVTGERVRRAIAFVCAAAFSAADEADRDDDDRERDQWIWFSCSIFLVVDFISLS